MMIRGSIAAVSYLNTVPFIYGIECADNLRAELLLSPPSGCAASFSENRADVALVPVAAIPSLKNFDIVTPYCLGSSGVVRTVVLLANTTPENLTDIYLDTHSLTSVKLLKVLCLEHWEINPKFHSMSNYSIVDSAPENTGFLLIGDKVFDYENAFSHNYDLAACWKQMTGLPFVFAAWVARKGVDPVFISDLNTALEFGINNIATAIQKYGHSQKEYAYEYLTKNIDFRFDPLKHKALELFWEKCRRIDPPSNPG